MPITRERRQASHPSDARSTHSDPAAEDSGKYCANASCCALRTTTVCLQPTAAQVGGIYSALLACTAEERHAQLIRSPSLLEMAAQTTVWARPSVHSDCGGKCIPHSHGPDRAADPANWRTSCLSASPMRDASRITLIHAQMRHRVSSKQLPLAHPTWTNKTAISVPQHAKFSLRGYRPAPRLG